MELTAKIKKKKSDLERGEKRLKSLQVLIRLLKLTKHTTGGRGG